MGAAIGVFCFFSVFVCGRGPFFVVVCFWVYLLVRWVWGLDFCCVDFFFVS